MCGQLCGQLCGRVCGQGEGGGAAQCRHGIKVLGLASHFSYWPARRGCARAFAASACVANARGVELTGSFISEEPDPNKEDASLTGVTDSNWTEHRSTSGWCWKLGNA